MIRFNGAVCCSYSLFYAFPNEPQTKTPHRRWKKEDKTPPDTFRTSPDGWHPLPSSIHPRHLSGEVGDAVPQLGPLHESGGYDVGVDDAHDDAHVDGGVLQPLPSQPTIGQATPYSAVEALGARQRVT
jgi:hypothetical protein